MCWVRQRAALSAPLKLYSPNQHATGLPVRGCVLRLVFLSSMVTLRLLAMESLCLPQFHGLGSVLPYRSRDVGSTDFDE